ncbi:hypothetical protein ACFQE5_02335 [Pseudonocardia hispaniensis]|uniref:Uncharacterized protein n=1 Tax=Pseudonocardia hispaniensis TaxID=904933 RepID=A0ABW1IX45_9PSEU
MVPAITVRNAIIGTVAENAMIGTAPSSVGVVGTAAASIPDLIVAAPVGPSGVTE